MRASRRPGCSRESCGRGCWRLVRSRGLRAGACIPTGRSLASPRNTWLMPSRNWIASRPVVEQRQEVVDAAAQGAADGRHLLADQTARVHQRREQRAGVRRARCSERAECGCGRSVPPAAPAWRRPGTVRRAAAWSGATVLSRSAGARSTRAGRSSTGGWLDARAVASAPGAACNVARSACWRPAIVCVAGGRARRARRRSGRARRRATRRTR